MSLDRLLLVNLFLLVNVGNNSLGARDFDQVERDLQSGITAVRCTAVKELARRGEARDVDLLVRALRDEDPAVRAQAARAFGTLRADSAVPALIGALRDDEVTVRYYVAHALGEIAAPASAVPLVAALRDPEWSVATEAAWALREIGGGKVADLVGEMVNAGNGPDIDRMIWIMRGVSPERLVQMLTGILEKDSSYDRLKAVHRLGELGGDRAVDSLIACLAHESPAVRSAAIQALGETGDRRAAEPMRQLVRTEKVGEIKAAASDAVLLLTRHRDLVAHWSFDENEGTTAVDTGGKKIHGKITDCRRVKGKVGGALAFAQNSCVGLGKPVEFPIANRPFTVTAWVKTDKSDGVIVARGGAFAGFSLYVKDSVPKFGIHRTQEGGAHIVTAEEKVTGKWVHLAGVVDKNEIRLYLNGKMAASQKTPGLIPSNCGQPMEIGFDSANSPAEITDHFVGIIDEVKAYHAAFFEKDFAEILDQDN